ncbi:MAG TPA: MlaD family protein [Solirubrobacterales bacterium]|jgi:virulence factor Mce-like protein
MRRRRSVRATLAQSPTMLGAVTVLVAIVAVFLAYNANSGLPFVPTYNISVQLPNAETLVPGNEVRIGGVRVGLVTSIRPASDPETGEARAVADLKLDPEVEPLPVDSTVVVRARSALGLKYLELVRGDSDEGYEPGSVVPLAAARPEPVDIDDVLDTFDEPTRDAMQANLVEFGNALAGRGIDLNMALGELPGALRKLEPVMRNLAAPRTDLAGFVRGASAAAAEVAPVAEEQARMFASLDTTFTALARVAPFVQETIVETPPTFTTASSTLPVIRPFLANSAGLFAELRPGVRQLAVAAPPLADALEAGAPALRRAPRLNRQLAPTARALQRFNDNATARGGLGRLEQTMGILRPTIRFIGPSQTVCNYWTILFENLASATSLGADGGRWQRFTVMEPPEGPNNEGSFAAAPANGGGDSENFLHYNPYPNTAAPSQSPTECEAGNEPYLVGRQVIGNVPGNQGIVTRGQLRSQIRRGQR